LREDKGWTYGARSNFSGTDVPGTYTVSAGVKGNATDSSVVEIMKEITAFAKDGMTQDELSFSRNNAVQSEALKYEAPFQKAFFLRRIVDYNLKPTFVSDQLNILKTVKREDLNTLAKQLLPVNGMAILVVGDKKKVLPGLQKLGYEVVELDTYGNPVSN